MNFALALLPRQACFARVSCSSNSTEWKADNNRSKSHGQGRGWSFGLLLRLCVDVLHVKSSGHGHVVDRIPSSAKGECQVLREFLKRQFLGLTGNILNVHEPWQHKLELNKHHQERESSRATQTTAMLTIETQYLHHLLRHTIDADGDRLCNDNNAPRLSNKLTSKCRI